MRGPLLSKCFIFPLFSFGWRAWLKLKEKVGTYFHGGSTISQMPQIPTFFWRKGFEGLDLNSNNDEVGPAALNPQGAMFLRVAVAFLVVDAFLLPAGVCSSCSKKKIQVKDPLDIKTPNAEKYYPNLTPSRKFFFLLVVTYYSQKNRGICRNPRGYISARGVWILWRFIMVKNMKEIRDQTLT